MALFGSNSDEGEIKLKLERKLYIAKESPEPTFDLSDCGLRHVPGGIYSLCKVFRKEALNLQDNQLQSLDEGGQLSDLYLLKLLYLNNNNFTKLDNNIRYFINLRELHLNNNHLKHLPEEIGGMVSLQRLDLSGNQLKSLPGSIGKLKKLRELDLRNNPNLKSLPAELCGAVNLISLELDSHVIVNPPLDVTSLGTAEIMKYFCNLTNVPYIPPSLHVDDDYPNELSPTALLDPFKKDEASNTWEVQEEEMIQLEQKMHEAAVRQKKQFLQDFTDEQTKLDAEVLRVQNDKDMERMHLISVIQEEENCIMDVVTKLTVSNEKTPQKMQQLLDYEEQEHNRLLEICRENYNNIRQMDTLKAMESLINEECLHEMSMQKYGKDQTEIKRSFIVQELESSERLTGLLKNKDDAQSQFVEQLLRDEDVQKAAVASLLEKVDTRSWSLVQEISLVEKNLAKLSAIELEKKKLEVNYNIDNLSKQRMQLSNLLIDLLHQKDIRHSQLVVTLRALESEKDSSTDYWLRNYQRLLESVPESFLSAQRTLDSTFANYLLDQGVIHCLPFIVKFLFSMDNITSLTDDQLKHCGINLESDRKGIIRAIQLFLEEKSKMREKLEDACSSQFVHVSEPSAPLAEFVESAESSNTTKLSECVVCMDNGCEVIFIPCGHLCCCLKCAGDIDMLCPLCRVEIEKK